MEDGTKDVNSTPPIVWRLRLAAAPERVFAAWLSAGDHERFWCERSEPLPDGNFRQHFIDGTVADCALEESKPPHFIRMRYFDSQVDIHLERRGDGTDLTLTARGVALREWSEVHAGWLNVLLPLKAWLDLAWICETTIHFAPGRSASPINSAGLARHLRAKRVATIGNF